jgi:TolB-like protein
MVVSTAPRAFEAEQATVQTSIQSSTQKAGESDGHVPPSRQRTIEAPTIERHRLPPKAGWLWATAVSAIIIVGLAALFFVRYRAPSSSAPTGIVLPTPAPIPEKSIAVLPFDNLSDDKQNAYFASGVQDEIISDLARVAELKVISRTSANLYKSGNPRNSREIAQQLGVAHLLEGSVQRIGNRVRINAQLVEAHTDTHV